MGVVGHCLHPQHLRIYRSISERPLHALTMAGLLSKAKQMFTSSRTPYIVLLGDVGTGKSTIVEKLSGETGRSPAASSSVTKCTETFTVPDGRGGSLIVADCPGSNAIDDKLRHNI